jgi:hypothetical protein
MRQEDFDQDWEAASTELLTAMKAWRKVHGKATLSEIEAELGEALTYLEKRMAMMNYPEYQRQGWPIGSGSVESGNKVVVEARLKGPGMHWAPSHVNLLLSLRNAICSDRWEEAWQDIATYHQQQRRQRFLSRAQRNTVAPLPPSLRVVPRAEPSVPAEVPTAGPKKP